MAARLRTAWVLVLLGAASAVASAQQAARPAPADPAVQAFKAWDKDANGALSQAEFRSGWQQLQRIAEVQGRLRQQFGRIDANDDGGIDASEYGQLLLVKQAGRQAPPLARFDANANGKLEFGEYVELVRAMAPRPKATGGAE